MSLSRSRRRITLSGLPDLAKSPAMSSSRKCGKSPGRIILGFTSPDLSSGDSEAVCKSFVWSDSMYSLYVDLCKFSSVAILWFIASTVLSNSGPNTLLSGSTAQERVKEPIRKMRLRKLFAISVHNSCGVATACLYEVFRQVMGANAN